jgi:hypothetical protein
MSIYKQFQKIFEKGILFTLSKSYGDVDLPHTNIPPSHNRTNDPQEIITFQDLNLDAGSSIRDILVRTRQLRA